MDTTIRICAAAALLLPVAAQSSAVFRLDGATHGHGQLLPHRIVELDANGNPTGPVIDVRTLGDLAENLLPNNPLLPRVPFPVTAQLPGGAPGNHYFALRFTGELDVDSILDPTVAGLANSSLTGAIALTGIDPLTGQVIPLVGRAFVAGKTYAGTPSGGVLPFQSWITVQGGQLVPTAIDNDGNGVPDGLGFPGTESGFPGDLDLVRRDTFLFVADTDGDLATHETFPAGFQLAVRAVTAVTSKDGRPLAESVSASVTVGPDLLSPELRKGPPPLFLPCIDPAPGDLNVDPRTDVTFCFTEDLQPLTVGPFHGDLAGPSGAIQLTFGPATMSSSMPITARPASVFDLASWVLTPGFPFPGESQIDVHLFPGELEDLDANANLLAAASFFVTGAGPGLVNAPVAPDAILVGLASPEGGLSVIDLNGFGASTGSPRYDFSQTAPVQADSNYPDNPNVRFQGTQLGLQPGTTTLDGGSAGVFTLTLDANLQQNLIGRGTVLDVADLALGHALDGTFNNAPAPFGCQAGGGDVCALRGLKVLSVDYGGAGALVPNFTGLGAHNVPGAENPISWAPHPNPPPLTFPGLCQSPFLPAEQPTSVDYALGTPPLQNLLVPGDPFGDPTVNPPIPPSGLLALQQNAHFVGPTQGQVNIANCLQHMVAQQVGHFVYVVDRARDEVVVLNSNRMVVIDRIAVPGAARLALGTSLDYLAITQRGPGSVSFLDVDPYSATFHQIVKTTQVGVLPAGIAWDPGNEDVLVCNSGDGSLSVISAFSLTVRKTVTNLLTQPLDVVITPRQIGFGFDRHVYFAWILQRDGSLAIFESGPSGIGGWGYDDVIGLVPYRFQVPKAIQPLPDDLRGGVVIAHEGSFDAAGNPGALGEGAVSRLVIDSALMGPQLLTAADHGTPQFRNMQFAVEVSVGEEVLSGIPVDLAFDDLVNVGALPNVHSPFSAGAPAPLNGKGLVRAVLPGVFQGVSAPAHLLVAVPRPSAGGAGLVDVLQLWMAGLPRLDVDAFEPGVQSVRAARPTVLGHYFRQ